MPFTGSNTKIFVSGTGLFPEVYTLITSQLLVVSKWMSSTTEISWNGTFDFCPGSQLIPPSVFPSQNDPSSSCTVNNFGIVIIIFYFSSPYLTCHRLLYLKIHPKPDLISSAAPPRTSPNGNERGSLEKWVDHELEFQLCSTSTDFSFLIRNVRIIMVNSSGVWVGLHQFKMWST